MEKEKTIISTCVDTTKVIKGKWSKIFGGCILCYGTLLLLMLFPVFGFALSFFSMGFLQLGLSYYIVNILNGTNVKAEDVFSKWKFAIQGFCMYTLRLFFSILWGILLIMPGVIIFTNYGFAKYILSEKGCDAFTALEESKKLAYGYRTRMFLLYLMYILLFVIVACAGSGIALLINYFAPIAVWLKIFIIAIFTIPIFIALILPFAEVSFANLYLEAKGYKVPEVKRKRTASKKTVK